MDEVIDPAVTRLRHKHAVSMLANNVSPIRLRNTRTFHFNKWKVEKLKMSDPIKKKQIMIKKILVANHWRDSHAHLPYLPGDEYFDGGCLHACEQEALHCSLCGGGLLHLQFAGGYFLLKPELILAIKDRSRHSSPG